MSQPAESASSRTRDTDDGGWDLVCDDCLSRARAVRVVVVVVVVIVVVIVVVVAVAAVGVVVVVDRVTPSRLRRVGGSSRSEVIQTGLQATFPRDYVGGVLRMATCQ